VVIKYVFLVRGDADLWKLAHKLWKVIVAGKLNMQQRCYSV